MHCVVCASDVCLVDTFVSHPRALSVRSFLHSTPLNCIVGMTSLLQDTPLNQFQQEAVRMITSSGDLLSTVVDDGKKIIWKNML